MPHQGAKDPHGVTQVLLMPSPKVVCLTHRDPVANQALATQLLPTQCFQVVRAVGFVLLSERVKVVVRLRPPFPHETAGGVVVNKEQSSISVFRE